MLNSGFLSIDWSVMSVMHRIPLLTFYFSLTHSTRLNKSNKHEPNSEAPPLATRFLFSFSVYLSWYLFPRMSLLLPSQIGHSLSGRRAWQAVPYGEKGVQFCAQRGDLGLKEYGT